MFLLIQPCKHPPALFRRVVGLETLAFSVMQKHVPPLVRAGSNLTRKDKTSTRSRVHVLIHTSLRLGTPTADNITDGVLEQN